MSVKGYLPELKNKEFVGEIISINDKSEFTPRNVLTKQERALLVFQVKVKFENTMEILKPGMTLEIKMAS
jgi:HlyD family secretion protein